MGTSRGKGIRVLSQALMERKMTGLIGADRHKRTPERTGHPNGYRMRTWHTRVGTIELAIPKVRPGHLFSVVAPAAPARGPRAPGGGARSVCAWPLDAEGR